MNPSGWASALDIWSGPRLKEPLARILMRSNYITANKLNVIGLIGGLGGAALALCGNLASGSIVFLIFSALDAIDGSVARLQQTVSQLGAWQDAFFGSVSETAFQVCVVCWIQPSSRTELLLSLLLIGSTSLTTLSKAIAEEYGMQLDWGGARILGRGLRIVLFCSSLLVSAVSTKHGSAEFNDVSVAFYIVIALNAFVLCERASIVYRGSSA